MSKNPYEILNIDPNASDEQIKEAYKELARKYQSDRYAGGPLSNIAQKKMNELDEAYDEIMLSRRNGNRNADAGGHTRGRNWRNNPYNQGGYGEKASKYPDIRAKISSNRIDDAEILLDGILPDSRDAEWHFLKGLISQQRGWLDDAESHFSAACEMDRSSHEYASAYNKIHNDRAGGYRTKYRKTNTRGGGRQCSGCDICSTLICADCCCECMGGDCIPCC